MTVQAARWDVYQAELADTQRAQHREKRPCLYCGAPTRALSQVCPSHSDLPAHDPGYTRPEETTP